MHGRTEAGVAAFLLINAFGIIAVLIDCGFITALKCVNLCSGNISKGFIYYKYIGTYQYICLRFKSKIKIYLKMPAYLMLVYLKTINIIDYIQNYIIIQYFSIDYCVHNNVPIQYSVRNDCVTISLPTNHVNLIIELIEW